MPERILVVDADEALYGLLHEWLAAEGCEVSRDASAGRYDLLIVDVANPRQATALLERLQREHSGAPIVALSSAFFDGICCTGAVAKGLGVRAALPKPVSREALVAAVKGA